MDFCHHEKSQNHMVLFTAARSNTITTISSSSLSSSSRSRMSCSRDDNITTSTMMMILLLILSSSSLSCASSADASSLFPRHYHHNHHRHYTLWSSSSSYWGRKKKNFELKELLSITSSIRGGDDGNVVDVVDDVVNDDDDDDDDERYSRQVYTLGARAHKLVRSSTVYIDGPLDGNSGLVYETMKNLALSGVKNIVILTSDDDDEAAPYYNGNLDDLGNAYQRAARAELSSGRDGISNIYNNVQLLQHYVQRLNPSVFVSVMSRSELLADLNSNNNDDALSSSQRKVYMAIDRPHSTCVELNELVRRKIGSSNSKTNSNNFAFVAVETAGVYGRIFCDFGGHEVYDADGETPLVTPLDRIEKVDDEGDTSQLVTVHCVDGERHDVSKNDIIQFRFRDGTFSSDGDSHSHVQCIVNDVQTPYRFRIRMEINTSSSSDSDINEFIDRINEQGASFSRMKIPQQLSFESLGSIMKTKNNHNLFTACDLDKSFDDMRRQTTFCCFQALDTFVQQHGRLPSTKDQESFWELVQQEQKNLEGILFSSCSGDDDEKEEASRRQHCRNFVRGCKAKLSPLQCVFGAISAQEALKAVTGLYYPTHQSLLYDCDEILLGASTTREDDETSSSTKKATDDDVDPLSAPGLRYILGDDVVDELQSKRIFVVGAGAIGCEILKNLASMGVGTDVAAKKKGKICLTDMDSIEKSNLSRQLLFRDTDVGKFKSTAAHAAALRFHPNLNVESHSSKVGGAPSGHPTPFDDKFWSKNVDVVMNALDNVEARLYMDSQCVSNQKALVDAGTMGPKGNVQVVVPHQSESYASSVDPPEPAIAVCTLKNFPYAISHTIQWGRELFDSLFERRPAQANDYMNSLLSSSSSSSSSSGGGDDADVVVRDLASRLVNEKGDDAALQAAEELNEDLASPLLKVGEEGVDWQTNRDECLAWASGLATSLFYKASQDLLSQHPLDSLDEDGEPFWGGTRRPPKALSYIHNNSADDEQEKINDNLVEFIKTAARLRLEAFVEPSKSTRFDTEEVIAFLKSSDSTCANSDRSDIDDSSDQSVTDRVRVLLEGVSSSSSSASATTLIATEFEKDDDTNDHVAFVNAASNLRAIAYGIPPVDAMETRRVAGNIVPAMISTTAFVSALSCIELIKLAQKAPLRLYRNAFVNLALPFFAFTAPLPAEEIPGFQGQTYTLWDRLTIKEGQKAAASGGITIRSLLRRVKKLMLTKSNGSDSDADRSSIDIASISCGPYMLYANFLHDDDEDVLRSSLWKLIEEASSSDSMDEDMGSQPREGDAESTVEEVDCSRLADLAVVVEDLETGDEVELPVIRVQRYIK